MRRASGERVSASVATIGQLSATPIPVATTKIARQLATSSSTAPMVGASIGATTMAMVR